MALSCGRAIVTVITSSLSNPVVFEILGNKVEYKELPGRGEGLPQNGDPRSNLGAVQLWLYCSSQIILDQFGQPLKLSPQPPKLDGNDAGG